MGDVIGDLNSRRGMVGEFIDKPGGLKLIKASVPLSEMFQYVSTLRGMSKGRAQYTMQVRACTGLGWCKASSCRNC